MADVCVDMGFRDDGFVLDHDLLSPVRVVTVVAVLMLQGCDHVSFPSGP